MEYTCSQEQFQKDTATHEMEVLLDNGLYRHLKFRRPGTGAYGFDIITWPGHLAISGDMGASVFTRLLDMFEFFRRAPKWRAENPGKLGINVPYWTEKLVANNGAAKVFSGDVFKASLRDAFNDYFDGEELTPAQEAVKAELWAEIEREAPCNDGAHAAHAWAAGFEPSSCSSLVRGFRFHDFWERKVTEYDYHLVWRLYAIAHAVQMYDDMKAKSAADIAHASAMLELGQEA